ncbi:ABC transporter ATP-binding protein [Streptomyces liliifuscus]|uniref:ABC transporter ATP-binding protein n=1 Tax=Streptomyces liliifuscus TaxID=2797636 RepID=A0A7T7I424_9ACTN|nr:ABC transporter ATP-binding protein [Streptomyces liliifuscus]QQM40645.1 ABC transporter ATP-binding protein [Streptomyces liliifuscus]
MNPEVLLSVRDLHVSIGAVDAVRGLSFDVRKGEVLAVVGESGAGKSLTARALLGMPPQEATVTGSVRMGSYELVGAPRSVRAALWGRQLALVPQDALSALSPVHRVCDQLGAAVRSVDGVSRKEARARAVAALKEVGIPADQTRAYPHEFSGGMRQRAVIAMALLHSPALVIADEPTTAQDPETRRQILDLLTHRSEATGTTLVLITHDLPMVREHADRVLVMYAGRLTEEGPVEEVFTRPRAPYTAGLLTSLPQPKAPRQGRGELRDQPQRTRRHRLPSIPGTPPTPTDLPPGCAFAPRCPLADATRCHTEHPKPQTHNNHTVACHHWRDLPTHPAELFLESV